MSATTQAILENLKGRFARGERPAEATGSETIQYNIRVDGKVAKVAVFDMKNFVYHEKATANDIEITIDDADFLLFFQGIGSLVELLSAGKIEVKGNSSLLPELDDQSKKIAAATAAAAAVGHQ